MDSVKYAGFWVWAQANRLSKGVLPPPPASLSPPGPLDVLLVHAHPVPESFNTALADAAQQGLESAGHSVTRVNLYDLDGKGKAFQPCLTVDERRGFHTIYPEPSDDCKDLCAKLKAADALVFVYPTWWMSPPAMLKGFVDRTFLPGTAFLMPHFEPGAPDNTPTVLLPGLENIKKVGVVTTFGSPKMVTLALGDNGRNMITRALLPLFSSTCTVSWMGLADMDKQPQAARHAFLDAVRANYEKF